jgi:hypothetical protein
MKSSSARASSTRDASPATLFWGLDSREAVILAAIVLVAIAIYLPGLRNNWVLDDWSEFVNNQLIHNWSFIWKSFYLDSWWFQNPGRLPQSAFYRPLENAWFAANATLFGMHPVAWHLAKIALHAVAVVLCFRVAQLLAGDVATGLLAAAIFAVMPAHVEAVVWASAIPEPLSTTFELSAMLFLIRRKPGWSRGSFIALIFYACAILTHESAILFPVIVAAYVFLFESEGAFARNSGMKPGTISALRACAPFVVVTIAYMWARVNALGLDSVFGTQNPTGAAVMRGIVIAKAHYSPAQLLMTLPVVLITYLAVLALPAMAGPTHAVEWIKHPNPLMFIYTAALIVFAAIAFQFARRSSTRRIYFFSAIWIVLTIAPALNLNALWYVVDDRYLYAPSFGWSLAIAVAAMQIAARSSTARKAVGASTAVFLAMYVVSTMQTERYWHDEIAFFQRCVEIAPNDSDHYYRLSLAASMNKAGDVEGARRVLERAVTLNSDDAHLHLRLAQQYQMMGREMDFEREFLKFNELSAAKIERQRAAEASGASQSPGSQ